MFVPITRYVEDPERRGALKRRLVENQQNFLRGLHGEAPRASYPLWADEGEVLDLFGGLLAQPQLEPGVRAALLALEGEVAAYGDDPHEYLGVVVHLLPDGRIHLSGAPVLVLPHLKPDRAAPLPQTAAPRA